MERIWGDVELIDPDAVMDWLSARGMGFVREGYERERRERERAEDAFRRWRDAMPVAWVPLFDGVWVNGDLERAEWAAVLEAAIPDPVERARALLDLLGSSGGPWNETPIYELDTHELLAAMPLETLLAAIGEQPDARQCEGVGRLLCCGFFERKHGVLRDRIPKPLRDHLLAYVEQTGDADKQRTARLELGEG